MRCYPKLSIRSIEHHGSLPRPWAAPMPHPCAKQGWTAGGQAAAAGRAPAMATQRALQLNQPFFPAQRNEAQHEAQREGITTKAQCPNWVWGN